MNEKPILFNAEMVRAVLDDRKTQTRRVIKDPFEMGCLTGDCPHIEQLECNDYIKEYALTECPYGEIGTRLWVRETFRECCVTGTNMVQGVPVEQDADWFEYRADYDIEHAKAVTWKPSIFMPRAASRINLEITDIRVERVQDISESDCLAEGIEYKDTEIVGQPHHGYSNGSEQLYGSAGFAFKELWDSINAKRKDKDGNLLNCSFDDSPWVWAVTFKRLES